MSDPKIFTRLFTFASPPASHHGLVTWDTHGSIIAPRNHGPSHFKVQQNVDYGPQINFTIWLLTALSAAFLALRVYCKFLRHRGLWWDDYILIASWVT